MRKNKAYTRSKTEMSSSPFTYANFGVVEPFADFKVDNFQVLGSRKPRGFYTFFLSHMHEGKPFHRL